MLCWSTKLPELTSQKGWTWTMATSHMPYLRKQHRWMCPPSPVHFSCLSISSLEKDGKAVAFEEVSSKIQGTPESHQGPFRGVVKAALAGQDRQHPKLQQEGSSLASYQTNMDDAVRFKMMIVNHYPCLFLFVYQVVFHLKPLKMGFRWRTSAYNSTPLRWSPL